jgi:DNA-binding FadR family transcriptional regulator
MDAGAIRPFGRRKNEPVRAEKLSHLVAEKLRGQIASGQIEPGHKLPSEMELMKQMGVSRPTLREAMRVLESEGLLQLGRGARNGASVLAPSIDRAARYGAMYLATEGTTLGEIHQVRTLLEPSLAGQQAQDPKKPVVSALEECVALEEKALEARDHVAAVGAVNEFHELLVSHSSNNALKLLAGMLHGISADIYPLMALTGNRTEQQLVWKRTQVSTAAHARLTKLIATGKAPEAEKFWREYMVDTGTFMVKTKLDSLRVQVRSQLRGNFAE